MTAALNHLHLFTPEIFVASMICIILLVDAYVTQSMKALTHQLSQATIVGAALLTLLNQPSETMLLLHNTFISDSLSVTLKMAIYVLMFGVFVYSRHYLEQRNLLKGEYYVLALCAMLGMMVLASAAHFLSLYMGLELMALSIYALVALNRESAQSAEAAMKYFILGALASGLLLYGISMIYGATGVLEFKAVAAVISEGKANSKLLLLGITFIMVGLGFKFGLVPFHMWVPDIYQGSPTAVTLLIASVPKIAAFAMLMRLLVDGMIGLHSTWGDMLIILAVLSMGLGNIVAIAQTNIKRMLAYSTISHMGFLSLGILTGTTEGYVASLFYTLVYALMSLGGFGMIILLSRAGFEAENISDFKGLNQRSPWYAFVMLILMLSMAGVPPMLGFWAKLSVISQVVHAQMYVLAVLAVLFSVIGMFYYLRIIKFMYFDKADENSPAIEARADMRWTLSLNALVVLGLGMFPQVLLQLCTNSL